MYGEENGSRTTTRYYVNYLLPYGLFIYLLPILFLRLFYIGDGENKNHHDTHDNITKFKYKLLLWLCFKVIEIDCRSLILAVCLVHLLGLKIESTWLMFNFGS